MTIAPSGQQQNRRPISAALMVRAHAKADDSSSCARRDERAAGDGHYHAADATSPQHATKLPYRRANSRIAESFSWTRRECLPCRARRKGTLRSAPLGKLSSANREIPWQAQTIQGSRQICSRSCLDAAYRMRRRRNRGRRRLPFVTSSGEGPGDQPLYGKGCAARPCKVVGRCVARWEWRDKLDCTRVYHDVTILRGHRV